MVTAINRTMANSCTLKWIVCLISILAIFATVECQNCSMVAVCNCTVDFWNKPAIQQQSPEITPSPMPTFILKDSRNICNITDITKNSTLTLTDMQVACTTVDPKTDTIDAPLGVGQFRLTLDYPCPTPTPSEHHGYSTGSILVIIFFTLLFAYLVLGMNVSYFLLGARGVEVIPNLAFWRELPALVRDGALFVQNGFKPQLQPESIARSPESYDAI